MTALDTIRTSAAEHGWTVKQDTGTWFQARKGDEVLDITLTKAGTVDYGALFVHPEATAVTQAPRVMDVEAGRAYQLDHLDRRTQARRARVLSWIAYAEVRAAARELEATK